MIKRNPKRNPKRNLVPAIGWHLISGLVAVLMAVPLAWLVMASLRQPGQPPPLGIEWWPDPLAWGNYPRIFEMLPLARYVFNSLLVSGLGVGLTIVTASWAGGALAQLPRRWRAPIVGGSLLLMLVPLLALWLPRLWLYRLLGVLDSFGALLAPALMGTSPLFVLLFYWSARRIPPELLEAARLEGVSAFGLWWRVLLPLARPTVLAVSVLAFLFYWGDFASALFYLQSQTLYTLPIGLQQLRQLDRTNWPLLLAGAVVMTLPPLLLFALAQRWLLRDSVLANQSED